MRARIKREDSHGNEVITVLTKVDKHKGLPVYLQIMNMIKKEVLMGNMKDGEQLPPVRTMSKTFGVNINTVMRALEKLSNENVVEAQHGVGYFIHANNSLDPVIIEKTREYVKTLKERDIDIAITKMVLEEMWKKVRV